MQVIFFPSRPGYVDPAVTRRVLDYMLFMNSKVLFKQARAAGMVCSALWVIPVLVAPSTQKWELSAIMHVSAAAVSLNSSARA